MFKLHISSIFSFDWAHQSWISGVLGVNYFEKHSILLQFSLLYLPGIFKFFDDTSMYVLTSFTKLKCPLIRFSENFHPNSINLAYSLSYFSKINPARLTQPGHLIETWEYLCSIHACVVWPHF